MFVKSLPKTRSAKIVRRAVRAAALGEELGDTSSVENVDSLRGIAKAVEQQVSHEVLVSAGVLEADAAE